MKENEIEMLHITALPLSGNVTGFLYCIYGT